MLPSLLPPFPSQMSSNYPDNFSINFSCLFSPYFFLIVPFFDKQSLNMSKIACLSVIFSTIKDAPHQRILYLKPYIARHLIHLQSPHVIFPYFILESAANSQFPSIIHYDFLIPILLHIIHIHQI